MYSAVSARLEAMRLETQESERLAAYQPGTDQPITPVLQANRAKGRSKGKASSANEAASQACLQMLHNGKCSFGDKCKFSHDNDDVEKARRQKSKIVCKYFQQGKCSKGDGCAYMHEQNGTVDTSTTAVAISCVAQSTNLESPSDSVAVFTGDTVCDTFSCWR